MKSKLARLASLLIALVVLSACSTFTPAQPDRLMVGLSPTNELGYEIDASGVITIKTREFAISTKAGMPVTNVTGYSIAYFDELDVAVGGSSLDPQTLNITVPAGLVCEDPVPGLGCNATSQNVRPGPGPAVDVPGLGSQLLNVDIAQAHALLNFPSGWYAVMTLHYDNARGSFQQEYVFNIVAPN